MSVIDVPIDAWLPDADKLTAGDPAPLGIFDGAEPAIHEGRLRADTPSDSSAFADAWDDDTLTFLAIASCARHSAMCMRAHCTAASSALAIVHGLVAGAQVGGVASGRGDVLGRSPAALLAVGGAESLVIWHLAGEAGERTTSADACC